MKTKNKFWIKAVNLILALAMLLGNAPEIWALKLNEAANNKVTRKKLHSDFGVPEKENNNSNKGPRPSANSYITQLEHKIINRWNIDHNARDEKYRLRTLTDTQKKEISEEYGGGYVFLVERILSLFEVYLRPDYPIPDHPAFEDGVLYVKSALLIPHVAYEYIATVKYGYEQFGISGFVTEGPKLDFVTPNQETRLNDLLNWFDGFKASYLIAARKDILKKLKYWIANPNNSYIVAELFAENHNAAPEVPDKFKNFIAELPKLRIIHAIRKLAPFFAKRAREDYIFFTPAAGVLRKGLEATFDYLSPLLSSEAETRAAEIISKEYDWSLEGGRIKFGTIQFPQGASVDDIMYILLEHSKLFSDTELASNVNSPARPAGYTATVTKPEKKIVYIVLDGVSDGENGIAEFGGKTPLEQANLPNLDRLVKQGIMGQMDTVAEGIAPQSDQAVLSILSYGEQDYPGRGIIETLGAEVDVPAGAIALRVNFATGHKEGKEIIIEDRRAGRIKEPEQIEHLAQEVNSKVDLSAVHPKANFKFIPTVEHRGILIIEVPGVNLNPYVTNSDPGYTRDGLTSSALEEGTFEYKVQSIAPQPKVKDDKNAQLAAQLINEFTQQSFDILEKAAVNTQRKTEGMLPANLILARDACSRSSEFKTLSEKTGGMKWAMFAEVPAEFGIGKLTGMDIVRIPVSQGNWEEEYKNIATKVQETLQKYDGLYVHIKGPDLPGHDGDAQRKVNITEAIDKHFLGPLLESNALKDAVVVVTADHTTSAVKQSHTADPVPVLIVDSVTPDATVDFTEKSAKQGSLRRMKGTELLDELIAIAKGARERAVQKTRVVSSQSGENLPTTYLENIKSAAMALSESKTQKPILHMVMGNEASDLDSMVASIAYAYAESQKSQAEGKNPVLFLPLMNISKEDFRLRTEAVHLFNQLGISEEDLLFTDTLNIDALNKQGFEIRFTLVDHNNLAENQKDFWPYVVEIIDHHKDEQKYGQQVKTEITIVGSATTLIAERILNTDLLKSAPELAQLLLGPILLDTANLSEPSRTTDRDRNVANQLLSFVEDSKDVFWEKLNNARVDVSSLSLEDLLRKDFKSYQEGGVSYGISSIFGLTLEELMQKQRAVDTAFEGILQRYNLDLLFGIVSYLENDVFKRQLFIYSPQTKFSGKVKKFLQNDEGRDLSLQLIDISDKFNIPQLASFSLAPDISRKKLAPLITEFMAQQREASDLRERKEADFAVAKIMPSQTTALDSPTLRLDVQLAGGAKGHFVVPAGTSTGVDEAKTIMNEGGFPAVEKSLNTIHTAVTERKLRADQLTEIAQMMLAMGKDTLGAEATLSYQMALAWAAARQQNLENYEFIRKLASDLASKGVPRTKIQYNITNGGEHAENSLDLQEFMIVTTGKTTAEANKMCDEIDRELGLIYQALGLRADPNDKGIGPLRGKEGGYKIENLNREKLHNIYRYAEEFSKVKSLQYLNITKLAEKDSGVHEFILNCLLGAILNAGYTADTSGKPGTVALALDAASTSMLVEGHTNFYNFEGRQISSAELIKIYAEWVKKYPAIDSLEDGLGENDWKGWMALIGEIGDEVMLIPDDLTVTQGSRFTKFIDLLKENGFIDDNGKVNKRLAILIKLNQNGFLTTGYNKIEDGYLGTLEVIRLAKEYGIEWVVSHRSKEAEPEDNEVSIADLAAGTNAYALKSGDHVQATRGVKEDRSATIDARERALEKTEREI